MENHRTVAKAMLRCPALLAMLLAVNSDALAQPAIQLVEMAPRCWATHVIQGERVRAGTRSSLIAEENASFWRSKAAEQDKDEARLETSLSATLERTRKEYGALPAQGLMQIVFNASTCQTLRVEIQPGYDPVQQNLGQR